MKFLLNLKTKGLKHCFHTFLMCFMFSILQKEKWKKAFKGAYIFLFAFFLSSIGNARAEDITRHEIPGQKVIFYDARPDGGRYYESRSSEKALDFADLQKVIGNPSRLTLIPLEKETDWSDAFLAERNWLIELSRENQYVMEIKQMCDDCDCSEGMTSDVYDYQASGVVAETDRPRYAFGEKVILKVANAAVYPQYFQVASVEVREKDSWREVAWNAPCGCDMCDYVCWMDPGESCETAWNQISSDCGNVPAGEYRFRIDDLRGYEDENIYVTRHQRVYSNHFSTKNRD